MLHFKTTACPEDPLATWAGVDLLASSSFLHVPSFLMWNFFPWGGSWGDVTFARISESASHPILVTNTLAGCIYCVLLEGHKQECHSVLVAAGVPPHMWDIFGTLGGLPKHTPLTGSGCSGEAAREVPGQPV